MDIERLIEELNSAKSIIGNAKVNILDDLLGQDYPIGIVRAVIGTDMEGNKTVELVKSRKR